MKTIMPLDGLRWGRDSGSAHCIMPQKCHSRTAWGGKNAISTPFAYIQKLTPVFLLLLVFLTSGCFSASAEGDLRPYYLESCHLKEVGHDSLCRFDDKIQALTRSNAISQSSLLYDEILDNIEEAYLHYTTLGISMDTAWQDTLSYKF